MTSDSDDFLPSTYLAVLSIIGNGAAYGYEINKIIKDYNYDAWVELKFSSVYKALSELEKRGLINGKKSDDAIQPSKKTYRLTRKGKDVLRKQIYKCLSGPPRPKTLFDLGISAMSQLTQKEAIEALVIYKSTLEQNLRFLESNVNNFNHIEQLRKEDPQRLVGVTRVEDFDNFDNIGSVRALFDRPAHSVRCQIDWLNSFIKQISSGVDFKFKESSMR